MISSANDPVRKTVARHFSIFVKLAEREDHYLKLVTVNKPTYRLYKIDSFRNSLCHAMQTIVTAYTYNSNGWILFAAKELNAVFSKFDNIYAQSQEEKTATIYRLLQELEACPESCNLLHMERFIKDLTNTNTMYETLYKKHTNEFLNKKIATGKRIREKIDVVYSKMIDLLEQAIIMDGVSNYCDFAIQLNTYIDELKTKNYELRVADAPAILNSKF